MQGKNNTTKGKNVINYKTKGEQKKRHNKLE